MSYKQLVCFIEGSDDERFLKTIIEPLFERKYDDIMYWAYEEELKGKLPKFLKSVESINNKGGSYDYIYFEDIHRAPCIREKKERVRRKLSRIDRNKIIVVKTDVEGWYLAGLSEANSRELKIKHLKSTDDITKRQFNRLIPIKFSDSRTNFLVEILDKYSLRVAKKKNKSLCYFIDKKVK